MAKGFRGQRVRIPQQFRVGGAAQARGAVAVSPLPMPLPEVPSGYSGALTASKETTGEFVAFLEDLVAHLKDGTATLDGNEIVVYYVMDDELMRDAEGNRVIVAGVNHDSGHRIVRMQATYQRPPADQFVHADSEEARA